MSKNIEENIIENEDGTFDITVYLTDEDYKLIKNGAKLAGKTIEEHARECLEKYIELCKIKYGINTSHEEA